MFTSVLGASPTSTGLYLAAGILAVIFMVGHLARRKKADPACKRQFARYPAIASVVIATTLGVGAWIGLLERDLYNYVGQFLGLYLAVLAIQATWNSMRAPGWWGRLILSTIPLLIVPLTVAGTAYSHAIYLTAKGDSQPLWAVRAYQYAVVTADYAGWLCMGATALTILAWVVAAIAGWFRKRGATTP